MHVLSLHLPVGPAHVRHGACRRARHGWRACRAQNSPNLGDQQPAPVEFSNEPTPASVQSAGSTAPPKRSSNKQAGSTDWFATQLTRRFGLVGGLAWVGFLTFGVVSEQIKTRRELADELGGSKDVSDVKEVVTPEGLRYRDLKVGGGAAPQRGFLVVLDYRAFADGELFEDTKARKKPIVFFYGSRPFTGGLCEGVEKTLATMRAGGKRVVVIPPELGFGANGAVLRPTDHVPDKSGQIPGGATLEYQLELVQVSIPPN